MSTDPGARRVWTVGGVPMPTETRPAAPPPAGCGGPAGGPLRHLALLVVAVASAGWVAFGGYLTATAGRPDPASTRVTGTVVAVRVSDGRDGADRQVRVRFDAEDGRVVEFTHPVIEGAVPSVGHRVSVAYDPPAADPAAAASVPAGAVDPARRLVGPLTVLFGIGVFLLVCQLWRRPGGAGHDRRD